jgi:hypothetical protein
MQRLNLNLTEDFMETAQEAIDNLKVMSQELERLANTPKMFSTDYGMYLEQMAHEMYRNSNELTYLASLYGDI